MTKPQLAEDVPASAATLAAGTLLGSLVAGAAGLVLLALRVARAPLAHEARFVDAVHVTLAIAFVALAFGALVLAYRLLAARTAAALARTLERRLGPDVAALVPSAWLELGVPTFFVGWLLTSGTRAWTPNVTVWLLLAAALFGSVVAVWTLRRLARALRPQAARRRRLAGALGVALAVGGAVAWAAFTAPFGLRYGKSHLLIFGMLVAWLSIVGTETLRSIATRARARAWLASFSLLLAGTALGFSLRPSPAARELFYAERPARWFGIALARLGPDTDGDGVERPIGFTAGEDCDDADPRRSPREPEIVGNGVDDNCFGGDQRYGFRELFAEAAAPPERKQRAANVLVLLLDSLRFDARSPNGVGAERSPALAAFARESLAFANYRTCSPRTMESFGDLFFGRLMPTFRGAAPTSAVARLTAAGVHTVDISSRFRHEHDRVSGWAKELSIPGRYGEFGDARTTAETQNVLRGPLPRPFFVATHLMGAHEPYDPHPACAAGATGYARYLCAVRLLDERVAAILRTLAEQGLAGDTVVVVSADHGEEFGEHGARYHANTVYDEVLHVPLLVRVPGTPPELVPEPMGCFDFLPTLLGAAGLPVDASLLGHDFSRSPRPRNRAQLARTRPLDARGPFEPKTLSVVVEHTKLLLDRRSGLEQYFDLRADPEEQRPLSRVSPEKERALEQTMDAWLSELARQSIPGERTASTKR
ncbi:MAG TPA: sulfatase [Polyangiaceae bacterium]